MKVLQIGERQPLSNLGLQENLQLQVDCALPDADIAAFALENGKLSDDRYMIFYNQPESPEKALRQLSAGKFSFNLNALPKNINEIYLTITHDNQPISAAKTLQVIIDQAVVFDVKPHLQAEKAVMLLRFYFHGDRWRVAAVGQGFNGGLEALVKHFGGEVADDAPAPEKPLSKVDLRKEKVKLELRKLGIEQEKMRVMLVMDASGSMSRQYKQGLVQETLERLVPVAARLDTDGELDFFYYANEFVDCGTVTEHTMADFVGNEMPQRRDPRRFAFIGGANNEPPVMEAVLRKHRTERQPTPTLVLFINDGGVSRNAEIKRILRAASSEDVFWQFIGLGNANYGVLRKLDTLDGRVVDNAGFFAVDDIGEISDDELYRRLLSELPSWLREARREGIIRRS